MSEITDLTMPSDHKSPAAHSLERRALEYLAAAYPMFSWYAEVTADGGSMLTIRCMEFTDWALKQPAGDQRKIRNTGFRIPVKALRYEDEIRRKILWAGGELLERAWANLRTGEQMKLAIDLSSMPGDRTAGA